MALETAPLSSVLDKEARCPTPCTMVIFGATGDLTHRKLGPALYKLFTSGRLPDNFAIVGYARGELDDQKFREGLRQGIQEFSHTDINESDWERFSSCLCYVRGKYDDSDGGFKRLRERLSDLEKKRHCGCNVLYYIATPPVAYAPIVEALGRAGLACEKPSAEDSATSAADGDRASANAGGRNKDAENQLPGPVVAPLFVPVPPAIRAAGVSSAAPASSTRVVIEKPFGVDLKSAMALNRTVLSVFHESQVYRIDHYLGKEAVQNILMLRFANSIFEPLWNQRFIDDVQITVAEALGVEERGGYYESAGALRDMIQNHLLQMMTLIAMEPPIAFDADAVRDEKAKVLRAVRKLTGEAGEVVRGQYGEGEIDGKRVAAYRQEEGVRSDSATETFVALRLFVDNWRWSNVPFYLRTGKRMPHGVSEIAVSFKPTPYALFPQQTSGRNVLVIRIQPNEGISLRFEAKLPGIGLQLRPVKMDFRYGDSFEMAPPSAYETLLVDALRGDRTLFIRGDEVEYAWRLVEPLLQRWRNERDKVFFYPAGSWGPAQAEELLGQTGREWRRP